MTHRTMIASVLIVAAVGLGVLLKSEKQQQPLLAGPPEVPVAGKTPQGEPAWSPVVLGLRGRIELSRTEAFNGTPTLTVRLFLENASQMGAAMEIPWEKARLDFRLNDAAGRELEQHQGPVDDMTAMPSDLVLPPGGKLSFDIQHSGHGVPADRAAMIDLGVACWVLGPQDGPCTLQGTIQISLDHDPHPRHVWHGRLELPAVVVPLAGEPLDPATAQQVIDRLGRAMIDRKSHDGTKARKQLSLIADVRVVPWYLKLLEINRYDTKFTALDNLARFDSDEALAGLEKGLTTTGADLADSSTPELAEQLVENIRHEAAASLSRSPHPRAKAVLISLRSDRSMPLRLTALHELGRMTDEASLEMIRQMTKDDDETISREAQRYLDLRTKAKPPTEDKPAEDGPTEDGPAKSP